MKSMRARSLIVRKEVRHKGQFVAIEPRSGEYFIGKTLLEAFHRATQHYPDSDFVFKRIGYRWTIRQAGGLRKASG